jgi:hypothetical protein
MPVSAIAPKEDTMLTPTVVEIRRGSARSAAKSASLFPTTPRS